MRAAGAEDGRAGGFHDGEIAVQRAAGVRAEAQRLVGMLDPADFTGGVGSSLAQRTFAVLTARDARGVLWASPLTGPPGFLHVTDASTLQVQTAPRARDPLAELPTGQQVGLIAVDFATRRRYRLNGRLTAADGTALTVNVEQAYGNCPQYIQQRTLSAGEASLAGVLPGGAGPLGASDRLDPADLKQVHSADTFFLGTTHASRGSDASHRGGSTGFVRVADDRTLWWPDYPGNNLFNSHGNLALDPTAALLFLDFSTGRTLHLTGRANLQVTRAGTDGDDGKTGRRVRFHVGATTHGPALPLRADAVTASPRNPPLRGTGTCHHQNDDVG